MDAGEGWDESNKSDLGSRLKRNYRGKAVAWDARTKRYKTLVPQTLDEVESVLRDDYGPVRVRPTNAFDPRGRFADKRGYGGSEAWPFDFARAVLHDGYRRGIWNAMHALWTSDYWKFHAQRELDRVWRVRRQAAKVVNRYRTISFEEALREQIQYNAF